MSGAAARRAAPYAWCRRPLRGLLQIEQHAIHPRERPRGAACTLRFRRGERPAVGGEFPGPRRVARSCAWRATNPSQEIWSVSGHEFAPEADAQRKNVTIGDDNSVQIGLYKDLLKAYGYLVASNVSWCRMSPGYHTAKPSHKYSIDWKTTVVLAKMVRRCFMG